MGEEGNCRAVYSGSVSAEAFELLESLNDEGHSRSLKSRLRVGPRELQVAVLRGFFRGNEVDAITSLACRPDVKHILDRDQSLTYVHKAYRVENQLREDRCDVYDRLLQVAHSLDAQLWQAIRPDDDLEPEIEYIVYDVGQLGRPGNIAPHCDNKSMVSMVVLLSDSSEFVGGVNCFEGNCSDEARMVKLERGDAVFFHGDACLHWITPVTAGRRVILQMELSSGRRQRCAFCVWLTFAALFVFMPALTLAAGTLCRQILLLLPVVLLVEVWFGMVMWRARRSELDDFTK